MKKQYVSPAAEKVEFDYTETVVASKNCFNPGSPTNTYNNAAPGSGGWVCSCDDQSWWIENGVCKK